MKFNETKSQERLINLMLQAGVEWPSNYFTHAAQDSVGEVWGYLSKPSRKCGDWGGPVATDSCLCIVEKIPNWHQTIITREQYEARDGWITWHGGECPVDGDVTVFAKCRGLECELGDAKFFDWSVDGGESDIIAYRIHKSAAAEPCESVNACIPDRPTIEQLIAEWKIKDAVVGQEERKLEEQQTSLDKAKRAANEAKKAVDDALLAAGDFVGGTVVEAEQPVITDWRDLRVGDVITVGGAYEEDGVGVVASIDSNDDSQPICVNFRSGEGSWPSDISLGNWEFILRPAKGCQDA